MATNTPLLPGRRISSGETLYTDWMDRLGDCLLQRAECLQDSGAGTVNITPQTRGDEGGTVTDLPVTTSALTLTAVGMATAVYLPSSDIPSAGMKKQLRLKVSTSGNWDSGSYMIVRLHQPIMFDNAKPVS